MFLKNYKKINVVLKVLVCGAIAHPLWVGALTDEETLKKFRIIVLELHCLNIANTQEGLLLLTLSMDKILKHFNVCHFHVNNGVHPLIFKGLKFPGVIELTFIRKDRCLNHAAVKKLPHRLDEVSCPNKRNPDFYLNFLDGVIK